MVDPLWDNDLGYGLLDVWAALNAAAAADVRFPNCIGAPASPGQPCALTPPMPPWLNTADIATVTPPQVGVANTITAQVRNDGTVAATVLVNFGVYVFAVGNNQFWHIGTQQVTIPPMTTVTVSQTWTPAAPNHQCIQVSIDFGLDTNFTNNVTQRNVQVAPAVTQVEIEEIAAANIGNNIMQASLPEASAVFQVQIENPFFVPARLEIQTTVDRRGWNCQLNAHQLKAGGFKSFRRTSPPTERENG